MSEPAVVLLDARGLICPLPVLRARRALRTLPPGGVLELHATDPAAVKDVPAFCDATGQRLLSATGADGLFVFRIEKTG